MSKITVGERILLHLSQYSRFKDSFQCPEETTQNGISRVLPISRAHVALELKKLRLGGKVEERIAHVTEARKRRKVYFLSFKGEEHVSKMRSFAKEKILEFVDAQGLKKEVKGLEIIENLKLSGMKEAQAYENILAKDVVDNRTFLREKKAGGIQPPKLFFGRSEEINKMTDWLQSREPRLLAILGLPGIGKTTLASKIASEFKGPVFWYKIHSFDSPTSIVRSLARTLQRLGKTRLANYISAGTLDLREISLVLQQDLEDSLVVFDDCSNSEEVQSFLSVFIEPEEWSVKVLVTSAERPSFYDRGDVVVRRVVEEVSLSGLDPQSSKKFFESKMMDMTEEKFQPVYELTRGHPLSLQLLCVHGIEAGIRDLEAYVEETILQGLKEEQEELLKRCSVFRKPFDDPAIKEGRSRDIRILIKKSLIQQREGKYELHDLLKEFFYKRLDEKERKEYHNNAANYYFGVDNLERLHHLIRAGRQEEATIVAIQEGGELIKEGKAEELSKLIQELPLKGEHQVSLHLLRGEVADFLGKWTYALEDFQKVAEIGNQKDRMEANIWMGRINSKTGDYFRAEERFEEALSLAEEIKDLSGEANAHRGLGIVFRKQSLYDKAMSSFERSIEYLEKIGDNLEKGRAWMDIGNIHLDKGNLKKAIESYKTALELVRDSKKDVSFIHNNLGIAYSRMGDLSDAIKEFEKSAELATGIGQIRATGYALSNAADNYVKTGELAKALDYCNKSLEIFTRLEDPVMVSAAYANFGNIFKCRKDWTKSEENFNKSIETLRGTRAPYSLASRYAEFGLMYEEKGDLAKARMWKKKADKIFKEIGIQSAIR